ncbi:hypothetical protein HMN09_00286900 [Mycena chlorophos]|uniref:Uncharacterized protein n=1 Tax=Mycena chlorophos TaxID=658473 RepID=A0A8H6TMP4_MYCCL|nr:hypothetical protein HMN09_00286900 [Mycena chlorophos]
MSHPRDYKSAPRQRTKSNTPSSRSRIAAPEPMPPTYTPNSSFRNRAKAPSPATLFANQASQPFMGGDDESLFGSYASHEDNTLSRSSRAEAFGYLPYEPLPAGLTPSGQYATISSSGSRTDKRLKRRSRSVGSLQLRMGPQREAATVQHSHAARAIQPQKAETVRVSSSSLSKLQRQRDPCAPTPPLKDKKWRTANTETPAPVQAVEYPVYKRKGMRYLMEMFA